MSTRSATIVRQVERYGFDEQSTEELFRFYRHCDGYPEGHGRDMAEAIIRARKRPSNNRNWCQCVFGEIFNIKADIEVESRSAEHADIEYLYVVEGTYELYGGKHGVQEHDVKISVYDIGWDESYESVVDDESKKLFGGTADEYMAWLEQRSVGW